MTKPCLPDARIAQALLNAYAAPGYVPHGLGLTLDDIQAVAPGLACELGLTNDNLASLDPGMRARLVTELVARMLE